MVPATAEGAVGRCAEEDGMEKVGISKDLDRRDRVRMQRVGHIESNTGEESRFKGGAEGVYWMMTGLDDDRVGCESVD